MRRKRVKLGPGRPPWKRPKLTRLATLSELVQGGGKSGSNIDGDALSTRKKGVG